MPDEKKKCAHEPCACAAPAERAYCSDYCEQAATSGPPRAESVCGCCHEGCGD
jgi:hypothetical protein